MAGKNRAHAGFGVGQSMGMTGKVIRRRMDRNLAEAGFNLNTPQVVLLKHIDLEEGVSQQTLTDHLFLDKTTMTRYIDILEERGLVKRVPDKADRRQKMIFLTDRGKRLLEPLARSERKTERETIRGIDKGDLETFRRVLRQIRANLDSPDEI